MKGFTANTGSLLGAIQQSTQEHSLTQFTLPLKPLLYFDEAITETLQTGLPFSYSAYIELADWTGRAMRNDKRGSIDNRLPPILERLVIDNKQWLNSNRLNLKRSFRSNFFERKPLLLLLADKKS